MAYTLETPIQKRFSDIDVFHHVNNVSQQAYFDLGKSDYYKQLLHADILGGSPRIVLVSTSTSYIAQIRLNDEIHVVTTCEKIGTKSITLYQRILCGDQVKSESRSVMVAFDFELQVAVEVPEEWRIKMVGGE